MTRNTFGRLVGLAATALALAGGTTVLAATAAQAAPTPAGGPNRTAAAGPNTAMLVSNATVTIPTWVAWGETEVCVLNLGPTAAKVRVQSQVWWGADPEWIYVNGLYENRCIKRRWGGFNVEITNESDHLVMVTNR